MRPVHSAVALATIASLGSMFAVTAPAPTASATLSQTASVYPCHGYGMMNYTNPVADLNQDLFTWGPYKRVKVRQVGGRGQHDINWKLDPYRQDSWKTLFNTIQWTGAYIDKSTRGITKERDPNAINGALAITEDWVKDHPYPWPTGAGAGNATHTRANFMMCLRGGLQELGRPVPRWLDASLLQHAAWLKAHTWPDHNVGTDQTLSVLGIGCVLGRNDYRDYAAKRLAADISRVIDSQGANNEQSVGYARWNHDLWGHVGQALDACRVPGTAARTIKSRRAGLQRFLDHAVKPDGTFHQLGDTQVERPKAETMTPAQQWVLTDGRAGAPPAERVKIYNAGYVFGRSGWGTGARRQSKESAYALRFGPQRVGHGHSDHTAITWNTLGRPILADTGTGSYNGDAWRTYYLSPAAHNQMVLGGQFYSQPATKLIRAKVATGADFYQFADAPLPGASRTRSIIVLSDPDIVIAVDKAATKKPTSFTQYWHLPYDESLRVSGVRATAARGGVTTTLLQLPAAGVKQTRFGQVRGATRPIQGWQWTDYFHKYPAPVATVSQSGTKAAMVTAVVASPGSAAVSVKPVVRGTTTTYTFRVGAKTAVVTLDAKGTLTRVR